MNLFSHTLANRITLIRIVLTPLFIFFILSNMNYSLHIGVAIFIFLSLTDFLDGYFARKKKQITALGKIMDPIADKLLIGSALILFTGRGVDLWITITILLREFLITALKIYMLGKGKVISSSISGKLKTIMQSIALSFVMLNLSFHYWLLIAAAILTVASGIEYIIKIKSITGNEIINVLNIITFIRFCLIPVFITLIFKSNRVTAIIIFALITSSDKLDGVFARYMNQITRIGTAFDSFADWTFIISVFFVLFIKYNLSYIWAVLLFIPGLVSAASKMIYERKKGEIPVTPIAKIAMGFIYMTILAILIDFEYKNVMMSVMIGLSYLSMAVYIIKAANSVYGKKRVNQT